MAPDAMEADAPPPRAPCAALLACLEEAALAERAREKDLATARAAAAAAAARADAAEARLDAVTHGASAPRAR
jgi:hypothetical protein